MRSGQKGDINMNKKSKDNKSGSTINLGLREAVAQDWHFQLHPAFRRAYETDRTLRTRTASRAARERCALNSIRTGSPGTRRKERAKGDFRVVAKNWHHEIRNSNEQTQCD
jgi:hypothetical protein